MDNKEKKISRKRKKWLKKQLKLQMGESKKYLYITAFFQWFQFMMRVISLGVIAKAAADLYHKGTTNFCSLASILIATSILGYLLSFFAKKYQGIPSQVARNKLKKDFLHAYKQTNGHLENVDTKADVVTVAAQGIDTLDTFYQMYQLTNLKVYLNCATILVIVSILFPLGGLIFLLALPLIPVAMISVQKKSKKIMAHYWSTYMDVGNLFIDNLRGLNTLYHYQVDKKYQKNFTKKAEDFRLSTMELLYFQLQSVGYMDSVMYVGVGVSGFVAVLNLAQGKVSLFTVLFFILIATEFFAPIRELGYGMHLLMMNTKMADHIFSFLDQAKDLDRATIANAQPLEKVTSIKVKDLDFSYQKTVILQQLNAEFHQGQLIAISGESGVGKSTLVKILQKQLTPTNGKIYFGEQEIAMISMEDIWKHSIVVSSESYLFNDTILNNLLMACDKDESALVNWLKERDLLQFVTQLPDGLHTIVGENGGLLSPGQRQQILCVRALLADRDIYIFDEVTSSVNEEHEADILAIIHSLAKEKLVLFITHKMKQVQEADQVLFLTKDQKSYLHSPKDLLKECSEYQTLVATQADLEAILYEK